MSDRFVVDLTSSGCANLYAEKKHCTAHVLVVGSAQPEAMTALTRLAVSLCPAASMLRQRCKIFLK